MRSCHKHGNFRISAESGWRIVPGYPLAPLPVAPGICLFNRLAPLDPSQSQGFGPLPLTAPRVAWVSETYAYPLRQKLLKTVAIKAAVAGGRPAKRAFFCERDGHQSRGGRRMSFMISVHPISADPNFLFRCCGSRIISVTCQYFCLQAADNGQTPGGNVN